MRDLVFFLMGVSARYILGALLGRWWQKRKQTVLELESQKLKAENTQLQVKNEEMRIAVRYLHKLAGKTPPPENT